jgi:multidrug resistance protein, MATE family
MLITNELTETQTRTQTSFKSLQHEVRPLINLAIPLVAGSLSFTLFGLINSYFLGPLGEVPLAAASLTMSISIIIYGALFGLIGPIGYFIGTAYGANDAKKISEVIKHGVVLGLMAGVIGFLLMALGLLILPYLGQPLEVLQIITPFWLLTGASMVPFFTSFVFKQFYDSTNKPWTGTALSLIPVIVNIPLTWVLVTGQFGLPALGLTGAGVSAVVSGVVGVIVMASHFYLTPAHAPYQVRSSWQRSAFTEQLREGLPMGVQYFLEGGAITVAGVLIGLLGATALAANQIVFSVLGILWIVPIGMSMAVGIRVAQAAGGGEKQRARSIGVTGMVIASLWSLLFTALLILWGEWVASLFVSEPEVIAVATLLFIVWGLSQIFDGIQSVGVGVLRGLFDNRYPTVVSLIAYWLISLPLGYLFGFVLNWGAAGVWAGYGAGLAIASALLVRRLWKVTSSSSDPLHEITKRESS